MTVSNTAAAAEQAASNSSEVLEVQTRAFFTDASLWVQSHWLQILIVTGIAVGVVLLLYWLRSWGAKLCERSDGPMGWGTIIGRAVSRTGSFFIVMLSVRLVSNYAAPPAMLEQTIAFLFTVAVVFQGAIWAREIILGAIEKKTESENYHGEALLSALGLIRLLVTVALFAIALVVVLDNLGVNVTGLVAGLGVGGIAIGLAAQGIFADLFAALAIIFDKPFRRGDKVMYDRGNRPEIHSRALVRRRSADHLEQAIARQGDPEHLQPRPYPHKAAGRGRVRNAARAARSASRHADRHRRGSRRQRRAGELKGHGSHQAQRGGVDAVEECACPH